MLTKRCLYYLLGMHGLLKQFAVNEEHHNLEFLNCDHLEYIMDVLYGKTPQEIKGFIRQWQPSSSAQRI